MTPSTTNEKCREIIEKIRDIVNADPGKDARRDEYPYVKIACDWGGNGLTIEISGSHTHVGDPDGSFEQLVDELHSVLAGGRGLDCQI